MPTKNKKLFALLVSLTVVAGFVLTGCQSPKSSRDFISTPGFPTRNNCYALLHQLLDEQKDVSLLRFIKHEDNAVKILIKSIAADSKAGAKQLEQFARLDPAINLNDIQLPPGELATRKAISSTKEKELLGQSGDKFELTLLLCQTEALSYGWHLAKVAAKNEPNSERALALTAIGDEMENLYHQAFELLLLKIKTSTTNWGGLHSPP